ncbi:helix-turn-helix transcriptional regulator [Shigella sonnei]
MITKERKISFSCDEKESFPNVLEQLMKGRTIREVSKAWGVAPSSINNYLYRGSIPRTKILQKIADAEGITVSDLFNAKLVLKNSAASAQELGTSKSNLAPSNQVEAIKERIIQLIGARSRRSAAKAWGMSISTLSNFLEHGSTPTYQFLNTIAQVEGVDTDWLMSGKSYEADVQNYPSDDMEVRHELISYIVGFIDVLDIQEIEDLYWLMKRKGAEFFLELLNEQNQQFFSLSEREKTTRLTGKPLSEVQCDDLDGVIDSLPIRGTLKQAIKVALAGDERMDKEILHRLEQVQNSSTAGTDVTREQADSRNVG